MASGYSSSSSFNVVGMQDLSDISIPLPHPYLREPRLYISGLAPIVRKPDLAEFFANCVPYRPVISQDEQGNTLPGYIEFKELASAERALATLQNRSLPPPAPHCVVVLSPFPPTIPPTSLPPPSALPRLVKQLPSGITDSELYDLFRGFGPLANVRSEAGFGPDIGVVEFWREEDARVAEEAMHCADVGGQNISIQIYQPRKAPGNHDFSASAPVFVPTMYQTPQQQMQQQQQPYPHHLNYSPPLGPYNRSPSQNSGPFHHGPGQRVQYAGPGAASASGLIDPCNLFIKNLDPNIDSNELFTQFRSFGQIVSARVMRSETGQSRGFGFVSYQMPDQAAAALNQMNGALLGSKQIVVRLHEPKQLRQEKLANRYSRSAHPRSNASGATSPAISDVGDSPTPGERGRRSSGSYYQAALTGTLSLPMRYEELSALSPVVRKEVLTGELSRQLKSMNGIMANEVDSLVESIVDLGLEDVIEGIQNPEKLSEQVDAARHDYSPADEVNTGAATLSVPAIAQSPSPAPSVGAESSQHAGSSTANGSSSSAPTPASAPEHPSTPISMAASLSEPPRTSSPSGSLVFGSEKDKLFASVARYETRRTQEITDLLLSLSKKERAMCLFNPEYLKNKIAEARAVLEAAEAEDEDDDRAEEESVGTTAATIANVPIPKAKVIAAPSPVPPHKNNGSVVTSPTPPSPPVEIPAVPPPPVHTLSTLAKLPAIEIIKLVNSPNATATGLPLPKADPAVVKATDEFVNSLSGKPDSQQKQLVGEKLFKVIKAFGLRNSPKVTIALLDSEDLRSLAHLMNSYPSVLKEKVMQAAASK